MKGTIITLLRNYVGWAIFCLELAFIILLFQASIFSNYQPSSLFFKLLMSTIVTFELINTSTHFAVLTSSLRNVMSISILFGVGLDVISTLLIAAAWISIFVALPLQQSRWFTDFFIIFIFILLMNQVNTHIRALRLGNSFNESMSVINAAKCHLHGIPGPFLKYHVFAYSDLAFHCFHLYFAARFVDLQITIALTLGMGLATALIGLLIWKPIQQLYEQSMNSSPKPDEIPLKRRINDRLICVCPNCHYTTSSFRLSIFPLKLCSQWLCSFEQLDVKLQNLSKLKKKNVSFVQGWVALRAW